MAGFSNKNQFSCYEAMRGRGGNRPLYPPEALGERPKDDDDSTVVLGNKTVVIPPPARTIDLNHNSFLTIIGERARVRKPECEDCASSMGFDHFPVNTNSNEPLNASDYLAYLTGYVTDAVATFNKNNSTPTPSSTTMVAALRTPDGAYWASCGDSYVVHVRRDDSGEFIGATILNKQDSVPSRNMLTRMVGAREEDRADVEKFRFGQFPEELGKNDLMLTMSDFVSEGLNIIADPEARKEAVERRIIAALNTAKDDSKYGFSQQILVETIRKDVRQLSIDPEGVRFDDAGIAVGYARQQKDETLYRLEVVCDGVSLCPDGGGAARAAVQACSDFVKSPMPIIDSNLKKDGVSDKPSVTMAPII